MKDPVVIGIATMKGREAALQAMLRSIKRQTYDGTVAISVWNNDNSIIDLADNGKFKGLIEKPGDRYYLPCDDDLEYPPTYIEDMVNAIDKHGCIVTHHGKILKGTGINYYRGGHTAFRCLDEVTEEKQIDVAGTGVCGFHTSYFNPYDLAYSTHKKMADIIFSLEAARHGKKIMILPHEKGYIKHLPIDQTKTIFATQRDNCEVQSRLADEIYRLRHA